MKIRQLITLLFVSLWLVPMASAQQIIQTVAGSGGPNGIFGSFRRHWFACVGSVRQLGK